MKSVSPPLNNVCFAGIRIAGKGANMINGIVWNMEWNEIYEGIVLLWEKFATSGTLWTDEQIF